MSEQSQTVDAIDSPGRVRAGWSRLRSIKGLGRDLAAVALLVAGGLGVTGYVLGHQRVIWPWDHRVVFYGEFDEAAGVAPGQGQEVRIAGVKIGDIVGSSVTDRGLARLKMSVKKQYAGFYDNATLVLRPKSPLNEMYVAVNPGGPPGHLLAAGSVIKAANTVRPVQLDEVLQHLDERSRQGLNVLLSQADTALADASKDLPGGVAAVDDTAKRLRPVLDALATRRTELARLVGGLRGVADAVGGNDQRVQTLVAATDSTLQVLAQHDSELRATLAQLPGLTTTLEQAGKGITSLTGELNPTLDGLRAAAGELAPALDKTGRLVGQAQQTVTVARPVVAALRPVAADLRPLLANGRSSLGSIASVSGLFDPMTATLVPGLKHIQDFVYNVASVASTEDANGGIARAHVVVSSQSLLPIDFPWDFSGNTTTTSAGGKPGGRR